MIYAENYINESSGDTTIPVSSEICERKQSAILYAKAAAICNFILFLLRGMFELSYLFCCAIFITAPLLLLVEVAFFLKQQITIDIPNEKRRSKSTDTI